MNAVSFTGHFDACVGHATPAGKYYKKAKANRN